MKEKFGKVLLIVGPAGSGKTALAQYLSDKLGWEYVEEDRYWVKNDWGSGLRNPKQEQIVQKQVQNDLHDLTNQGKNAVLEFILYHKAPPSPLTRYVEYLDQSSIPYQVVVLKPSVKEILRRMKTRGRTNDLNNLEAKRKDAEHQVQCLEASYINPEWVIDSTNMSIDELYNRCLRLIGQM